MPAFLPVLLALTGCTEPPKVKLDVRDVWNEPIAGATIVQEGVTERFTSGADGTVMVEVKPGTLSFMAGQDGFIKDLESITIAEEADKPPAVVFHLYPEPENPGFYGVSRAAPYVHLEAQPIQSVATEMSTYHGIKDIPKSMIPKNVKPLRFVFNSTLRVQEIKRQDLRLSKLRYLEEAEVQGVLGAETVDLNLWVADGDVKFDVKGLQSKDDYLLEVEGDLEPGFYAFHAQNVLDSRNADVLDKLPKELKVVFPFEVK
ncbi:MAG: carboxypeptidase regulatory-like domain-containing protein [Alphaproteobacteria bacterium]|nr:carboxypeptidase regulatory-like domain-containing protein [Alphaproteobacteria bacterium]